MKNITLLFLIITLQACQIKKEPNPIVGTWNKCFRDGEYREYKIDYDYMLMLSKKNNEISLFKNKIENNTLIISGVANDSFEQNVDTLLMMSFTDSSVILKSNFTKVKFDFTKMENNIKDIDSTNLSHWKNQTMLDFQKRATLSNCTDIRTEKEKNKPKRHWRIAF